MPRTPSGPPEPPPAEPPGTTSGPDRDLAAEERDRIAEARDAIAEERDERAEARDQRAGARARTEKIDLGAADDRAAAAEDRHAAAGDRRAAAEERAAASADRAFSAGERTTFAFDELTSAYRREQGISEFERDAKRAERTQAPFVLAFIDVDGLKATNDSLGHNAGDQLLRDVVATIRRHVRSYDPVVRVGGDEFLCGMLDLDMAGAVQRFEAVQADLVANGHGSITTGLAELEAQDSIEELIQRADEAMYRSRRR